MRTGKTRNVRVEWCGRVGKRCGCGSGVGAIVCYLGGFRSFSWPKKTRKRASPLSRSSSSLPSSFTSLASAGGFAVVPNFLSDSDVAALKRDVATLKAEGRFAVAGVGDASTKRVSDDIRRCEQCFLFPRLKHGTGGDQSARKMLYSVLAGLQSSLEAATGQPLEARALVNGIRLYLSRQLDVHWGVVKQV